MKFTAKHINEIAEELEAGMKVYINKETLEFQSVLDWEDMSAPEPWNKIIRKIENEWTDVMIIEKLESKDSFRIMEDFVFEIDDEILKEDLIKILSRKSPFAYFKAEIDESDYRQKWFDFRAQKYEEYVREQLDYENIEHE
jgi:hypothetical protein